MQLWSCYNKTNWHGWFQISCFLEVMNSENSEIFVNVALWFAMQSKGKVPLHCSCRREEKKMNTHAFSLSVWLQDTSLLPGDILNTAVTASSLLVLPRDGRCSVFSVQEAQVCSGWDSELEDNWGSPDTASLEHSEPSFLVPGLVTSEPEQPALTLSPGDRGPALGQTRPGHKTKTKTPFDTQQLASSRAQLRERVHQRAEGECS